MGNALRACDPWILALNIITKTFRKHSNDIQNIHRRYTLTLINPASFYVSLCGSIAIAEGMKSSKQVIIMTPASLRMNYVEELKKCGDSLYRKNQFWEFINTQSQPTIIEHLSSTLQLSIEYIGKQGGAWLMNITKLCKIKYITIIYYNYS